MNGSASSVILAAVIGLIFASFLPDVEDPWPETIGLGFPFTLAGAGAIVGLVLAMSTNQSSAVRDAWVRRGTVLGFSGGGAFYVLALGVEVL